MQDILAKGASAVCDFRWRKKGVSGKDVAVTVFGK